MNSIIAIIFGAVQGLTEFIPVSSSGHLLIVHELFPNFIFSDALAFDVALHFGTLIALIAVFWKDCIRYLRAFFSRSSDDTQHTVDKRVASLILLAIIPAGLVGYFFESIIESVFRDTIWVVLMLIAVSVLFFLAESRSVQQRATQSMADAGFQWKHALTIGVMQVLALIPGTSRSGITIVTGLFVGLSREQAARFSFLISIPLVLAASLKKFVDFFILGGAEIMSQIPVLLFGLITAAVVGYVAITVLLQYLQKNTLRPFAVYRIILAILVIVFLRES